MQICIGLKALTSVSCWTLNTQIHLRAMCVYLSEWLLVECDPAVEKKKACNCTVYQQAAYHRAAQSFNLYL